LQVLILTIFSRHLDGGELIGDGGYLDGSFDAVLDYFFLGHFIVSYGRPPD
jgi:hypothetical protein